MNFSDTEVLLMMHNDQDRAFAAGQINIANSHIRKVNSQLAQARRELEEVKAELAREKAKRHAAEARLRRH